MSRTEDSRLLRILYAADNVSILLILLLSMAATPAFGQETVKLLAMVSYDQASVRVPATIWADAATNSVWNISTPLLQYQSAVSTLERQNNASFLMDSRLERPSAIHQHDLFQLVHKQLCTTGRSGNWLNIEAGYGQISHADFSIEEYQAELQRPGFAYLKASLSF